ncbi:glycosyltransferase [Anatilimnocola floriformis]|uniref:glycosyltransferase n=1 Tax=Anatilimnocola floriformis TaxID=2948575 RepID=UPI0020C3D34B|nr:glycosyltransferase [Anatilimnocola floriformis]
MIVATILSGNSSAIVAEAVHSVLQHVDLVLLIDTGITDDTLEVAERIAGEKFRCEVFPWQNDFAAARNFSLAAAAKHGGTWALTVDTDERVHFPGYLDCESLRQELDSRPEVLVWLVPAEAGDYTKERLIRVPATLEWHGPTHEAFVGVEEQQRQVLTGCSFWELAKSAEDFERKLLRDRSILERQCELQPDDGRWWYYLGQTHEGLHDLPAAIAAFRRCGEVDAWQEEAAWAYFKAASCLSQLERHREAIECCALGMTHDNSLAELPWLAAFSCQRLGENRKAEWWAEMAILLGNYEGLEAGASRVGFRHLPAWYEGPFDVLRVALAELGDERGAASAELNHNRALQRRLDYTAALKNAVSANAELQIS